MQNLAEITSESISLLRSRLWFVWHCLDWLTDWRSQIPIKREAWQDKKWNQQTLCLIPWENQQKYFSCHGCQKGFQSWADWSNLFEYPSFSFQYDNTTEP